MKTSLILCLFFCVLLPLHADDGAASVSAGGLVAVREPRITMAKEVLSISLKRVVVDYDFRNDTDAAVTTEVAFPIPAYTNDPNGADLRRAGFDDFKLFVGGRPMTFQTEIKAVVKGRDVSALLRRDGVDIATFGHLAGDTQASLDFKKLTPVRQKELIATAAFVNSGGEIDAAWKVEKRYHWTQTFPAHATVRIRHEYTPVAGSQLVPGNLLQAGAKVSPDEQYVLQDMRSMCATAAQMQALPGLSQGTLETQWVDFILTTANSWKQPIEDFTLIVERTDPRETVSFCWDGPVAKVDANHFQAHAANLVPRKELHIGFYALARAR